MNGRDLASTNSLTPVVNGFYLVLKYFMNV